MEELNDQVLLEKALYRDTEGVKTMYIAWAQSHSSSQVGGMAEVIGIKGFSLP